MNPIIDIKGKRGVWYQDVNYDSKEEVYFFWWLQELVAAKYVLEFDYHLTAHRLSEAVKYSYEEEYLTKVNKIRKTRTKTKVLYSAHFYKPDFKIVWGLNSYKLFYGYQCDEKKYPFYMWAYGRPSWIDVKGKYNPRDSDTKAFVMNQKWMFQRHDLYVQAIVPEFLFEHTFYPERYRYTDVALRPRKGAAGFTTLRQFITVKISEVAGL